LLLSAGTASAVLAQEAPPRDFLEDRGFLIAKATTLPKGTGYVAALMPGAVGVAYGLTDRLTAQGGAVPWTLLYGGFVGFASLRYGIVRSSPLHVSVGGFGIVAVDDDQTEAAGWPYLTATVGADAFSATGLIGVGSSTSVFESDFNGKILLQFEGEARVLPDLKVIIETLYLGEDSETLGGAGVRFFGSRGAVEAGVAIVLSGSEGVLPWAAIAWSF
jgi:hypothetical protein